MSDSSAERLVIFDTTLRDGEQSPGASKNLGEKLEIAHALKGLGVAVIEAGFPIASPGDFEAVQAIAREVEGPVVCGLARCNAADIDRAWEALKEAPKPRIHVFLATSAIHREFKLHMAKEEIIRRAVEGVERARGYCEDIEFSPEDAARTELDFLAEVVERAIEAGATTVNIPDTVGYAVPAQYAAAIRHLKKTVRGIDHVVLSVHCHNDLGLAVANSVVALIEGARQVECTINGLGEAQMHTGPALWTLESFNTNAGTGTIPSAAVCLQNLDGNTVRDAACGDGPIDAVFKTIERITGVHVQLRDYQVRSVTVGED